MNMPPMMRQSQLVEQLARALTADTSSPWDSLTFRAVATSSRLSGDLTVVRDGSGHRTIPPRATDPLVPELRAAMYRPGVGTWFEMELMIESSGRVTTRFDYDREPQHRRPFTPGEYLRDQQQFPRDVEHQPEWLRAKLAEASEAAASASNARLVGDDLVLETTKAWSVLRKDAIASGHRDHPDLAPLFEDDVLGGDDDFRRWYSAWFPIVYPGTTVTDYQVIPRSVARITLAGDPDTLQRIAGQPW